MNNNKVETITTHIANLKNDMTAISEIYDASRSIVQTLGGSIDPNTYTVGVKRLDTNRYVVCGMDTARVEDRSLLDQETVLMVRVLLIWGPESYTDIERPQVYWERVVIEHLSQYGSYIDDFDWDTSPIKFVYLDEVDPK